jgi:hypothetical protein
MNFDDEAGGQKRNGKNEADTPERKLMNEKFRSLIFWGAWAVGAVMFLAQIVSAGQEKWKGQIYLLKGDAGTIEFTRENARITGKIIIARGEYVFETPIYGQWQQNEIVLRRALSETSSHSFKGTVTFVDAKHVKMEGQFAAGFSGSWTCECELLETIDAGKAPGKERREKPVSPITGRSKVVEITPRTQPRVILDFVDKASKAKWTNAWLELGFPGDPADNKGYARLVDQARLEDGKVYPRALETHPHRKPRGMITGRYSDVTIPASGAELRSGIGFFEDATGTDGVYFEVRCEFQNYTGVPVRREYFKTYDKFVVADFSQDLSRFKGLKGMIILSVNAGKKSADQDRAVWMEPKLMSLEKEPKFATFVGGAVGSNRNGNQLTNAWGGKSGQLFGNIVLYLLFANVDNTYSVGIESYQGDNFVGAKDLGTVNSGRQEIWETLQRTVPGEWRERIIFNGTYVGDLRYTISKVGE